MECVCAWFGKKRKKKLATPRSSRGPLDAFSPLLQPDRASFMLQALVNTWEETAHETFQWLQLYAQYILRKTRIYNQIRFRQWQNMRYWWKCQMFQKATLLTIVL